MQADAAFETGVVALAAARAGMHLQPPIAAAALQPATVHRLPARRRGSSAEGMHIVGQQLIDLLLCGGPATAASHTQAPYQALRQYGKQRIGKVEGVHAHVEQPRHGFGGAVGVQGRQHQVAGQRGFDRHLRRLLVAHLAHHDHVRVRSQERAQSARECPFDLGVHLHLAQTWLGDFDRVFRGPDLALRHVDVAERRMQRGGLAGTGRADAQHQAVRPLDGALEFGEVVLGQVQAVQRDRLGGGQDTHHHVFQTAVGRNCGDPQFEFMLRRELGKADLAVLRPAPFADIEIAHDLDARDHRIAVIRGQLDVGAQQAILAKADADLLVPRITLDVDVGDALLVRFDDHIVDQPNQRVVALLDRHLFIGAAALLTLFLKHLDQLVGIGKAEPGRMRVFLDRDCVRACADFPVHVQQHLVERSALRKHRDNFHLRDELGFLDRGTPARGVVHGDNQTAFAQQQRHDLQPARHGIADLLQCLGFTGESVEVHQRVTHLARQCHLQIGARHHPHADQHLTQWLFAIGLLTRQRVLQLDLVDQAQRDKRLADTHHRHLSLALYGFEQLVGRHDLTGQQYLAEFLAALPLLHIHRLLHLQWRGAHLCHQHFADAWPELETVKRDARNKLAQHAAIRGHRREQEQSERGFDVAHGLAGQFPTFAQQHPKTHAGWLAQNVMVRVGCGRWQRNQRCGEG